MSTIVPGTARRRRRRAAIGVLAATAAIGLAACGVDDGGGDSDSAGGDASDFPKKTIELTAPSSAGGSTDLISRAIAQAAEKPLGQSVVVVNKEGANGAVGGKAVLSSKPDGYKIVLLPQSLFAITPLLEGSAPIDLEDMQYIGGVSVEDYVLVVPADSPVKSLDDLLQEGKKVKFGTTGAGTGSQLAQALMFAQAKVDATDVPFDGGSELITALLGSQVDVGATQVAEAAPQIKGGKLRAIAVFSEERLPSLKDVPTAKEAGSDVVVNQRRWLAAPKDTPDAVLDVLREDFATAKQDPSFQTFLDENHVARWEVEPDNVKSEVETARATYEKLVDQLGVDLGE